MSTNAAAYLVGTETTQTPDCTSFVMVGCVDEPKTEKPNPLTPADYNIQNSSAVRNRRRAGGVQTPPNKAAYLVGTETTQTPDCTSFVMVGYVDDPIADGDFTIKGNLRGNRLANYIPRIAGG